MKIQAGSILICFLSLTAMINAQNEQHPSSHQLDLEKYRDFPTIPDTSIKYPPALGLSKPAQKLTHEVFGYLPYWEYNIYSNLRYDLLTTIAYFCLELNASGNITNAHNWPVSGLIAKAHSNGMRVVLCAILFDKTALQTLLQSATNRANCINNLVSKVVQAGADGINIDFEGVPASQRTNLVTFMQAFVDTLRALNPNSHISMATPAVDWSGAWDYQALANICNTLFIMGYDYYYSGSTTSGPNSPLTGGNYNITNTVNDYLTKTNNNSRKILLGVPYFGHEWQTSTNQAYSPTLATGKSVFYDGAEANAALYGKLWDSNSQTPWYRYYTSQWNQGWYDDSLSLALKYNFAKSKQLQGIGIWALGYDGYRSELWQALQSAFTTTQMIAAHPTLPDSWQITNYPNPSNSGTTFRIHCPDADNLSAPWQLQIYALNGQLVYATTFRFNDKVYSHYWSGRDNFGHQQPAGIYLAVISGSGKVYTLKFTLLK